MMRIPMAAPAAPRRSDRAVIFCVVRRLLLALVFLLSGTAAGEAQQERQLAVTDTLWEVRLTNGESYVGQVVEATADSIVLRTVTGTRIQFSRAQVARARVARGTVRSGSFWAEDPNTTRLFFSPTARTLPQGGGYFGVYELFIPFVTYGITDWLLIAGGSPFYLGLTGDFDVPFYAGPKIRLLDTGEVSASIGSLTVLLPEEGDDEITSVVYGVGTWGGSDDALSFGAGWGYVDGELTEKPLLMLGGEARVGRFTKLMTENMYVPGEEGIIVSGGLRLFGERLSADVGVVGWVGEGGGCCLPIVNFVYNFGVAR
jgi:hypothetical protein